MTSKKALGKGLGALIGEGKPALSRGAGAGESRLRELPLDLIAVNRRQPRRSFSEDELQELAASIRALGVVQPVVVRPLQPAAPGSAAAGPALAAPGLPTGEPAPAPHFELIAGERRLRAARLAGLDHIPALVRPADEVASLEIALAENVAREDLNSIEEAQAYAALVDEFGLTQQRVGELVGRSRVAVTNLLRLLELPDDVQRMLEQGELTEGHGRALLGLPDHGQRRKVARLVVTEGLTVRQTEALVRKLGETSPEVGAPPAPQAAADFTDVVDELYGVLEAPVRIRSGKRGGTIQIAFRSKAELDRLVALLRSLGG